MKLYRYALLLLIVLFCGTHPRAYAQASPYNLNLFKSQSFTATGQTGAVIQLNGLTIPSTVGSSYASGTLTVTGVGLTTATFEVLGSSDNGVTFYPLPVNSILTPTTLATTTTVTANGLYQVNLANLTHVKFTTTGTFTATSISITLTASPNALISRLGGAGSASAIQALLLPLTGCGTNGTVYSVVTNSCIAGPAPSISGTVGNAVNIGAGNTAVDAGFPSMLSVDRGRAWNNSAQTQNILTHGTAIGGYTSAANFGDSITWGTGSTTCTASGFASAPAPMAVGANCYAALVDLAAGIAPANSIDYGQPGSEAADTVYAMFNNLDEDVGSQKLITLQIGTNDSADISQQPQYSNYQPVYQQLITTLGSWASVPKSFKQPTGTVTATNWTTDTTFSQVTGLQSTTNGATFNSPSFVSPVSNASFGFWYRVFNSNGGTFTAQLYDETLSENISAPITISTTQTAVALQSLNSYTNSVYTAFFPQHLLAATHSYHIIFTVTSATSASNIVSVLSTFYSYDWNTQDLTNVTPQIWIADIPFKGGGAWSGGITQFNTNLIAAINTLQLNWLPVNFVDSHTYLTGLTSQYLGLANPHPNPAGHQLLATAFQQNTVWAPLTAAPAPASAVNTTINTIACPSGGSCTVPPSFWPSGNLQEGSNWTTTCTNSWYGGVTNSGITATLATGCAAGTTVIISSVNNVTATGSVSVTPVTNVLGNSQTSVLQNGCSGQYFYTGSQWQELWQSCNEGAKGAATLASGTVTVSSTRALAASNGTVYVLSYCGVSGTPGFLTTGNVVNNTSFVINSLTSAGAVNTADNSKVCWSIK